MLRTALMGIGVLDFDVAYAICMLVSSPSMTSYATIRLASPIVAGSDVIQIWPTDRLFS